MPTFKTKSIILAVLISVTSNHLLAENKAEILESGTVEVISTTPLQALGTPISEIPANVQVGTSKEISQQKPLNLAEFMDNNLGSINTSNGVGNPYQIDVSYRGFNASPILGSPVGMSVYFDGIRFNEPFGDIVNWDLIPINAISSINLIPGSNPLFGLNTLGGALAISTKSGASFPGLIATASGGSWGRRAFQFEMGGETKNQNIDYFVAGNIFHEDGWRDHSPNDIKQIFTKTGWHNEKTDLDLSLSLADNEMHGTQALPLSMWGNTKKAYTYPDAIKNKLAMISLKGSHFLADDKLIAGNIYYRMSNAKSFNSNAECSQVFPTRLGGCPLSFNGSPVEPFNGNSIDAQNLSSATFQDGYGSSLQLSLLKNLMGYRNNFTIGTSADWSRVIFNQDGFPAALVNYQTITADSGADSWVRLKTRSDYYGFYATDNFAFNDQFNITLSGRYNIAKVNLKGGTEGIGNQDVLSGNHEYKRFNPAIGFNYNPNRALGFYGSYNEGMRAPSPIELSCADPDRPCSLPAGFNGDPDLKKVVAKTWEGGIRGKLTQKVNWTFALYNTRTSNDIQFITDPDSRSLGYFKNVGETERKGLELALYGKLDRLSFAANYGFVDATYQSSFDVNTIADIQAVNKGNKIPGIAQQTFKLRTSYEISPSWEIGGNLIASKGQYARGAENNQVLDGVNPKIPGYAVFNLDTHYAFTSNWTLFAKVNNIFNEEYSTFGQLGQNIYTGENEQFRTPSAPRAGWIGITYNFGSTKKTDLDKD